MAGSTEQHGARDRRLQHLFIAATVLALVLVLWHVPEEAAFPSGIAVVLAAFHVAGYLPGWRCGTARAGARGSGLPS